MVGRQAGRGARRHADPSKRVGPRPLAVQQAHKRLKKKLGVKAGFADVMRRFRQADTSKGKGDRTMLQFRTVLRELDILLEDAASERVVGTLECVMDGHFFSVRLPPTVRMLSRNCVEYDLWRLRTIAIFPSQWRHGGVLPRPPEGGATTPLAVATVPTAMHPNQAMHLTVRTSHAAHCRQYPI